LRQNGTGKLLGGVVSNVTMSKDLQVFRETTFRTKAISFMAKWISSFILMSAVKYYTVVNNLTTHRTHEY
jgi:hypothetical protein